MRTYMRAHRPVRPCDPPGSERPSAAAGTRARVPAGASILVAALIAAGVAAACAPRPYVAGRVDRLEQRLERTAAAAAAPALDPGPTAAALAGSREQVQDLSARADLALARAREAKAAARGSLLLETVYVIDKIRFPPGSAALDDRARSVLDQLAERLRVEDAGYYIEVQGHADGLGSEEDDLRLGRERAEAVRHYLHREKGLPLHRIDAVSLGSGGAAAAEGTPAGRARNRRAVVVVLRQGS